MTGTPSLKVVFKFFCVWIIFGCYSVDQCFIQEFFFVGGGGQGAFVLNTRHHSKEIEGHLPPPKNLPLYLKLYLEMHNEPNALPKVKTIEGKAVHGT